MSPSFVARPTASSAGDSLHDGLRGWTDWRKKVSTHGSVGVDDACAAVLPILPSFDYDVHRDLVIPDGGLGFAFHVDHPQGHGESHLWSGVQWCLWLPQLLWSLVHFHSNQGPVRSPLATPPKSCSTFPPARKPPQPSLQ